MNLYSKLSALDTYNTALLALTFKNMKEPEKVAELNALLPTARSRAEETPSRVRDHRRREL